MNLPRLSAYHSIENSFGSLDPLGLVSISGKLANRLTPGLRERMRHPRYLTAMAVGAVVCSCFDEDKLAVDEITPPWQVYEWYVASSLVKRFDKQDPNQLLGMPGRLKTTGAMRNGFILSGSTYLTTPAVSGFHGVYRTLAKSMKLLDETKLGEFGLNLVDIWEREQNLVGFQRGVDDSTGTMLRKKLQKAVIDGLAKGAVSRNWNWETYGQLADSLAPKNPGKTEANLLFEELKNGNSGERSELISFLMSKEGQRIVENNSEMVFHHALIKKSIGNTTLLKAIRSYEGFSRLLFNAYFEILSWMNDHQNKGNLKAFLSLTTVKKAIIELPNAFAEITELLQSFSIEAKMFNESFKDFGESRSAVDFVRVLLEHHMRIQRNKLPTSKAPWVIEYVSDSYLLDSHQDFNKELSDDYVHLYRTRTLQSFLNDLGKI